MQDSANARRGSRLAWTGAVVVTALTVALLLLQAGMLNRSAGYTVGITVDPGPDRLTITHVDQALPAGKAGVLPGSRILSVNGRDVSSVEDYDRALAPLEPGTAFTMRLEHDGESREVTVSPGAPFPWARYLSILAPVLAYLALGLMCLMHWRQDIRARLLALLVIAIALELALPVTVIGHPVLHAAALSAYFALSGLQLAVELHLVSLIPGPAPWLRRWPRLTLLLYAFAGTFGLTFAAAALLEGTAAAGTLPLTAATGFAAMEFLLPAWALSVGAILIYQMAHYQSPIGRQQAGLVLLGVVPWIAFILVETLAARLDFVLPVWWLNATNWTLLAFPVAVFVAIFRFHLFDMELVVRRTLVYGSLTALVVGALYALLATAWPMASPWLGELGAAWLVTALALALGIGARLMRDRLEHAIEVRVFPERHALRRHLIRLAASLPVRGKLPLMGAHLADEICLAFRAQNSAVVMIDPKSQLPYTLATARTQQEVADTLAAIFRTDARLENMLAEHHKPQLVSRMYRREPDLAQRIEAAGFVVIVPLVSHDQVIGALCLGSKQSGNGYPGEELELLNLLSHHVSTAFENARLAEHATYEGLTGLYRREVILDILERECARAIQCHEPIAVAMVDIDQFKSFNDDHGHLAGDLILQRVARTIQNELRSTDLVGRFGGEEFLAVLPTTDIDGARAAMEHVRAGIELMRLPLDSGVTVQVKVSIGLAAVESAQGDATQLARTLLESADQYLYEAKKAGRNRVVAGSYAGAA